MRYCKHCEKKLNDYCTTCTFCRKKVSEIKIDDKTLKKILGIDDKTLLRFKEIRRNAISEAKKIGKKNGKIRAIGISGTARGSMDMAREDSNSEFLLKKALDQLKKLGASVELIPLREYNIQHCRACYSTANTQCHFYCSCYPKGTPAADDMTNILYDKILQADIIVFATPVNNFKLSTLMATFIDRCISLDGSLAPADLKDPKNKDINIKHSKFVEIMADQKIPGSGYLRRFMGKTAGIIVTGHEEGASLVISTLFMTLNNFGMTFPSWSTMYAMASILNPTCSDRTIVRNPAYQSEAQMLANNTFKQAKLMRKMKTTAWEQDYSSD